MNQIAVTINGRRTEYELPERHHELRPKDWPQIAPFLLAKDQPGQRTLLLYRLLRKAKSGKAMPRSTWQLLGAERILALLPLLDWLYQDRPTEQPFESVNIRHEGQMLSCLLPAAGLRYITLIEYAMVDMHYTLYAQAVQQGQQQQAHEHFHKVIAYLCRPRAKGVDPTDAATFKGDLREQFNTVVCDARLSDWERIGYDIKLPIMLFFAGCKAAIHESYKGTVFVNPLDEETGEPVQGAKPAGPQAWIDLAYSLSGGRYGTLEQTMYAPLDNVLYDLYLQRIHKL